MFEDLVRRLFPTLGVEVKKKLIAELRELGKDLISTQVAKTTSRLLVKGLDGVIGAAVKHLPLADAQNLAGAYVSEIQAEIMEFSRALNAYAPHVVAVAVAKKEHGSNSPQANEARKLRDLYLSEVRQEVSDLLKSTIGETPED